MENNTADASKGFAYLCAITRMHKKNAQAPFRLAPSAVLCARQTARLQTSFTVCAAREPPKRGRALAQTRVFVLYCFQLASIYK